MGAQKWKRPPLTSLNPGLILLMCACKRERAWHLYLWWNKQSCLWSVVNVAFINIYSNLPCSPIHVHCEWVAGTAESCQLSQLVQRDTFSAYCLILLQCLWRSWWLNLWPSLKGRCMLFQHICDSCVSPFIRLALDATAAPAFNYTRVDTGKDQNLHNDMIPCPCPSVSYGPDGQWESSMTLYWHWCHLKPCLQAGAWRRTSDRMSSSLSVGETVTTT